MKHLRILDVGQCGYDGPRMTALFREALHATVDGADSVDEAIERVGQHTYDVVLVNRVLAFEGSSGLDVIKQIVARDDAPPVMLVSDKPDAQQQAVALGALPGFGKSDLYEPATLDRIVAAAKRE